MTAKKSWIYMHIKIQIWVQNSFHPIMSCIAWAMRTDKSDMMYI